MRHRTLVLRTLTLLCLTLATLGVAVAPSSVAAASPGRQSTTTAKAFGQAAAADSPDFTVQLTKSPTRVAGGGFQG